MLTIVGCGGSETKVKDSGADALDGGPDATPTASLSVPQTPIAFGTVDVGATESQTFVVTNTGRATSGAIRLTPTGAGLTATGCPSPLAAGATCVVTVTYAPTVAGTLNGSVAVLHGTATTGVSVAVTGSAVLSGDFSVTPSSIALGVLKVNVPAPLQTITITNNKAGTLALTIALNSTDLIKDASTDCAASLAGNKSCKLVVGFRAATAGAKSTSISISGNAAVKEVAITATVQAAAELRTNQGPIALTATVGSVSSPISVVVVNAGEMATGILTAAFSGANATDFAVTPGADCLAPIQGGRSCTYTVTYAPKAASTTAAAATLTVTDPGATSVTVAFTGTANTVGTLAIAGTTDLGTVLIGASGNTGTFTVTNNGGTATGALAVTISDTQFSKVSDTCSATSLAAAGTCQIGIKLVPAAPVGIKSAILSVKGAATETTAITLTGAANSPASLTGSTTIDFGDVRVNAAGAERTVTITNAGGTASGALTTTRSGAFGAFPVSANTCSAALAPGGTCAVTINFIPLTAGSQTSGVTISDGTGTVTLTLLGNALAAAPLTLTNPTATSCQETAPTAPCFNNTVVGGTSAAISFTLSMGTPPTGTIDSGAITVALGGANASDFAITSNGCTTPLVQNGSCLIQVAFTPAAASLGLRQASLNVTSANGGIASSALRSNGLAIVELVALDAVTATGVTGLDFGQVSLLGVTTPPQHSYRVVVRGPVGTVAAPVTTVVTAALANSPATSVDFRYPSTPNANPCNATTLNLLAQSASGTNAGNWSYDAALFGMKCEFDVEFYPQGTKGAKTATLSASGSGGGTDSKTLTGVASGPLTIIAKPAGTAFPASVLVGTTTNPSNNLELQVKNDHSTASVGPIVLALAGADASQFQIVLDNCTGQTLTTSDRTCEVTISFTPTSEGAKAATLTATAGAEATEPYAITANAGRSYSATLSPNGYIENAAPATPVFTTLTAVAGSFSDWTAFTVANPAGAQPTSQVVYGLTGASAAMYEVSGLQDTATGCGNSSSKTLNGGESCVIWVRFKPAGDSDIPVASAVNPNDIKLVVSVDGDLAGATDLETNLAGRPSSQLSLTPATTDFGSVATGVISTPMTLTVRNLSTQEEVTASASMTLEACTGLLANQEDATVNPFQIAAIATSGPCASASQWRLAKVGGDATGPDSCTFAVTMTGQVIAPSATINQIVACVNLQMSRLGETPATTTQSTAIAALKGISVAPANLVAVGFDASDTSHSTVVDLGSVYNTITSAPVSLLIKNTGGVAALNLAFNWEGLNAGILTSDPFTVLSETGGCAGLSSLAPGATCLLKIRVNPSSGLAANFYEKNLVLAADGGLSVRNFHVQAYVHVSAARAFFEYVYPTGTATQYGFFSFQQVSPGVVLADSDNATLLTSTFQLRNITGSAQTVNGTTVEINGANAADFTLDLTAGTKPCSTNTPLATGDFCTFTASFNPTVALDDVTNPTNLYRFANVTAWETALGNGRAVLGLMGQVQKPADVQVSPATLAYGEVVLAANATKTITLTNAGEAPSAALSVTAAPATSAELTATTNCNAALAAGASCTVTVTLKPLALGAHTGTVTIGGTSLTVAVTGTGVSGSDTLILTPEVNTFANAVEVGATSTEEVTITLNNPSTGSRTPQIAIALGGAGASQFEMDVTACDSATTVSSGNPTPGLDAGTSCVVILKLKPTGAPGTVSTATLTVTPTGGAARTATVTGTSKSPFTFLQSSSAVTTAIVTTAVSGTAIEVELSSNVASATQMLSTTVLEGADAASFRIRQNDCLNQSLAPGGSCLIYVQYDGAPTTTAKTTTLRVTDGTVGNVGTVTVQYP